MKEETGSGGYVFRRPETEGEEEEQLRPYFAARAKEIAQEVEQEKAATELEEIKKKNLAQQENLGQNLDRLELKLKTYLLRLEERKYELDPKTFREHLQRVLEVIESDVQKLKKGDRVTLPEDLKGII